MSTQIVFVLDDNAVFRKSTAFLLEAMGYSVEHYDAYEKAISAMYKVPKEQAACLLLDIRMPDVSGLDVHDLMNERGIDIPVIYMTGHGDVPLAVTAMRKGALTFLEKPLDDDLLQSALGQALSLEVQSARISAIQRDEVVAFRALLDTLTLRERDVVTCVVNELSNKEAAEELEISVKTVELHRSRAMRKLQAKNAAHLGRLVRACGPDNTMK